MYFRAWVYFAVIGTLPFSWSLSQAAESTSPPVTESETSVSKQPLVKVWERTPDRGNRFLQLGDKEVVPISQLAQILSLDTDPMVMKKMSAHSTWKKVSLGANILTIGLGALAFAGWGSSVTAHGSGFLSTEALTGIFIGAVGALGIKIVADQVAERKLYDAQVFHNNQVLKRTPPVTSGVTPEGHSVSLVWNIRW